MSQLGCVMIGVLVVFSAPPCVAQAPTPRAGGCHRRDLATRKHRRHAAGRIALQCVLRSLPAECAGRLSRAHYPGELTP